MDVRVFPFSFPPIRGGAQGGVSPTPTPDPQPDCYDLTDVEIKLIAQSGVLNWSAENVANFKMRITGIVVADSSLVQSVTVDLSTLSWTAGGTAVDSDTLSDTVKILNVADPNQGYNSDTVKTTDSSVSGKSIGVSGDVTFTAYDSNGEILQQDTITVVGF